MNRKSISALVAGAAVIGSATVALAYPGQRLAAQAHVSLAQARSIASHAVKGTIVDQELEKEAGGSGLRYTFDLKTASGLREVGVDANTGAVLENSADNGSDEKAGAERPGGETGEGAEKPGGESGESDGG